MVMAVLYGGLLEALLQRATSFPASSAVGAVSGVLVLGLQRTFAPSTPPPMFVVCLRRWQACMKLGYPTEDCQALLKPFSTGKTSFLNHTEFWIKLTPGYWKNLQEYKGALSTALRAPPGSTYVDPDADKVAIVPGDGIAPARMLRGGRRPGPSRGF